MPDRAQPYRLLDTLADNYRGFFFAPIFFTPASNDKTNPYRTFLKQKIRKNKQILSGRLLIIRSIPFIALRPLTALSQHNFPKPLTSCFISSYIITPRLAPPGKHRFQSQIS
jgi:hypothetical protein